MVPRFKKLKGANFAVPLLIILKCLELTTGILTALKDCFLRSYSTGDCFPALSLLNPDDWVSTIISATDFEKREAVGSRGKAFAEENFRTGPVCDKLFLLFRKLMLNQ